MKRYWVLAGILAVSLSASEAMAQHQTPNQQPVTAPEATAPTGELALGTIRQKPWVVSGEVIPRWITTLGGSFDHRVVDGDLSARFMADVAAIMEEPALLLD